MKKVRRGQEKTETDRTSWSMRWDDRGEDKIRWDGMGWE